MSTTPHIIAPEEIMAHLDGELSADRAGTISAHIETCADCRILVQEFQQTKYNVAMWQVASLPSAIENRIQSAVAKAPAPGIRHSTFFLNWSLWSWKQWVGGLAATAALFVVLIGSLLRNSYRSSSIAVDSGRVYTSRTVREELAARTTNGDRIASSVNYDSAPPASRSQMLEQAKVQTESEPSAAPDSNGIFHGLGDHAKNSFSVDGQPISNQQSRVTSGPMIARTVSLSILVKDFEVSRSSLDAILTRHNGYSANLTVSTPQGSARSLQASLRVPAPQLAAAFVELKALGHVENENQTGEEVSQQHADLVARLKNSRETEQRLQAILTERTGKISDVLAVEQEIARVRGEIEQMEAEQKNLEHRVDFATIDLNLSEEYKAKLDSAAPSISTKLHNALVNGYRNVADTLLGLILFFAEYGPILLFWVLLLFIPAWLFWRRRRHATAAI